jgi:hypothetical protein
MDAIPSDRDELHYSDKPPIIVAASSDAAMLRALSTVEASGLRVADRVTLSAAKERIERQVSATAIWVELDEDCGGPMDELLGLVSRNVAGGCYAAIVSTSAALLDPVMAGLGSEDVELIVDADDSERAAALAIATTRGDCPCGLATSPRTRMPPDSASSATR